MEPHTPNSTLISFLLTQRKILRYGRKIGKVNNAVKLFSPGRFPTGSRSDNWVQIGGKTCALTSPSSSMPWHPSPYIAYITMAHDPIITTFILHHLLLYIPSLLPPFPSLQTIQPLAGSNLLLLAAQDKAMGEVIALQRQYLICPVPNLFPAPLIRLFPNLSFHLLVVCHWLASGRRCEEWRGEEGRRQPHRRAEDEHALWGMRKESPTSCTEFWG